MLTQMHEYFASPREWHELCCELIDAVTLAFDAIAYGFKLMGHPVCKMAYVKQSVQYFQIFYRN
jgi:hypothetical protein